MRFLFIQFLLMPSQPHHDCYQPVICAGANFCFSSAGALPIKNG